MVFEPPSFRFCRTSRSLEHSLFECLFASFGWQGYPTQAQSRLGQAMKRLRSRSIFNRFTGNCRQNVVPILLTSRNFKLRHCQRGSGVESGAGPKKSAPNQNISLASRGRGRRIRPLFETGGRFVRHLVAVKRRERRENRRRLRHCIGLQAPNSHCLVCQQNGREGGSEV